MAVVRICSCPFALAVCAYPFGTAADTAIMESGLSYRWQAEPAATTCTGLPVLRDYYANEV